MIKMERLKKNGNKIYWIVFAIFVLSGVCIYFSLTKDNFVWADEAYTFAMIKHNVKEIWNITAADVHPPLYYFILKGFMCVLPDTLLWAKLVSIIPYIIILIFGGVQFKKLFGKKVSLVFMLLFLAFPSLLIYSVEIRMYSWAALFVFANALYGYKCLKSDKLSDWILFALFGVASAYTHYFSLVSTGIVYFIVLLASIKNKKLKRWFMAVAITIVLYLPWLGRFIQQLIFKAENEYWIDEITLSSIIGYLYMIFGVEGVGKFWIISFLLNFAIFIRTVLSKKTENILLALSLLAIPVGTVAVGVGASWLVRPVFLIRYLIPAFPLVVAFMAIFSVKGKSKVLLYATVVIMVAGGSINYVNVIKKPQTYTNPYNAGIINDYADSECYVVLTESSHFSSITSYYEKSKPIYRLKLIGADNPYENMKHIDDFKPENYKKVVLITDSGSKDAEKYAEFYDLKFEKTICEYEKTADLYVLTAK